MRVLGEVGGGDAPHGLPHRRLSVVLQDERGTSTAARQLLAGRTDAGTAAWADADVALLEDREVGAASRLPAAQEKKVDSIAAALLLELWRQSLPPDCPLLTGTGKTAGVMDAVDAEQFLNLGGGVTRAGAGGGMPPSKRSCASKSWVKGK